MPITDNVLHSIFTQESPRTQVLSRGIYDLLEASEGYRDVVFVRFTLLRDGLCDAFPNRPQLRELCRRLRQHSGIYERLVGLQKIFQETVQFLAK